jgi:hypothetical protein
MLQYHYNMSAMQHPSIFTGAQSSEDRRCSNLKGGHKRDLLHVGVDGAGSVLQVALQVYDPI